MNATLFGLGFIFMLAASALVAEDATGVTTKEVMESVITPATNTLWGAEDPQTDEDWKVLEDAAIATITAGNFVAHGGAGPNDVEWASKPEWKYVPSPRFTKI